MATAREHWHCSYREARKLARFIETFHDKQCALPVGQRTLPQLSGFQFSRLSGDNLRWIGEGLFAPSVECQRARLACLRHQRPRLPE